MTAVHWRERLEFLRQYRNWTSTVWRHLAFLYESRFMLHRIHGHRRIWYETSEFKESSTIAGRVQAGGGSIMI